jgi:hypothetical protein
MINAIHLTTYIDYRIANIKAKAVISENTYLEYKNKVDSKWYNKLFGCKYSPDMWDNWFFIDAKWMLNGLNKLKAFAIYNQKMGQHISHEDIKDIYYHFNLPTFYVYCEENNIPY